MSILNNENKYVKGTDEKHIVNIDGRKELLTVYEIRLDQLYYNDQNTRICTWVSQYLDENNLESIDMSDKEAYNDIIQGFIEKSNPKGISRTLGSIRLKGQEVVGVVLTDGRIVDGNRRFTCLRNLAKEDPKFNYFKAVILDKDYGNDATAIKLLELEIQKGKEKPEEYDAVDDYQGLYEYIDKKKLLTETQYARACSMNEKEVHTKLEEARFLERFLEYIGMPEQFYVVRDLDIAAAIPEIYKAVAKKEGDERDDLEMVFFANLIMPNKGEKRNHIRKMNKVINSSCGSDFIEAELDIAAEVSDKIVEAKIDEGKVTSEALNNIVCADTKLQSKINATAEAYSDKIKLKENKNQPMTLLQKAMDNIENIDMNVVAKYAEHDKDDFAKSVKHIKEKLDKMIEGIYG